MKKYIYYAVIIILLLACSACSIGKATSTTQICVSIDALHFSSENDMINRIKTGKKTNSDHQLETIDHYFRIKELPEGAKLLDIRVKAFYIAFDYMVGDGEPNMKTNQISFIWYRTMFGDDMQNGFSAAGVPWESMDKNQAYSFTVGENFAYNDNGEIDENLPKIQENIMVMWVRDNCCFQVNAPLWFTEDDALKYCIAERVDVK
jgi:hypothetical protein